MFSVVVKIMIKNGRIYFEIDEDLIIVADNLKSEDEFESFIDDVQSFINDLEYFSPHGHWMKIRERDQEAFQDTNIYSVDFGNYEFGYEKGDDFVEIKNYYVRIEANVYAMVDNLKKLIENIKLFVSEKCEKCDF